jgi:membrane-bound inhibitor of C-type lysozyme
MVAILAMACQKDTSPGSAAAAANADAASAAVTQLPTNPADAATSPAEAPPTTLQAYVWSCAGGEKIVMRNLAREHAIAIDLRDGTRRLEQVSSGSGVRYEDAFVSFRIRGSSATLERKGTPAVQCRDVREASLRESARLAAPR